MTEITQYNLYTQTFYSKTLDNEPKSEYFLYREDLDYDEVMTKIDTLGEYEQKFAYINGTFNLSSGKKFIIFPKNDTGMLISISSSAIYVHGFKTLKCVAYATGDDVLEKIEETLEKSSF